MNNECSICLNPIRKTRQTRELACGHIFHSKCIDKWSSVSCPICRRKTNGKNKYNISIKVDNNFSGVSQDVEVTDEIITTVLESFDIHDRFQQTAIEVSVLNEEELYEIMQHLISSEEELSGIMHNFGITSSDLNSLVSNT